MRWTRKCYVSAVLRSGRYGGILRFSRGSDRKNPEIEIDSRGSRKRDKTSNRESRAPTRCGTASACSRRQDAVFSAGGPDASLEAVARTAGVGIGTLYRHFPTREALFEAVYRREVQQLADLAEQLKDKRPIRSTRCASGCTPIVKFVATKKGMSQALALAVYKELRAFFLFVRQPDAGDRLACSIARSRPVKFATTSARKTCCERSSACATRTTSRVGRRAYCGWSMCSSTACAFGTTAGARTSSSENRPDR